MVELCAERYNSVSDFLCRTDRIVKSIVQFPAQDQLFLSLTLFQDLQLTDSVDWVNGHPPIAEPPCGFRGEKCISEYNNSYLLCVARKGKHFC